MAGIEHGDVTNEEFMEEVTVRISKTKKKANSWEKIGEKFYLSSTFPSVLKLKLLSL